MHSSIRRGWGRWTGPLRAALAAAAMALASSVWAAPSVVFVAVDIADSGAGDLWRYDYVVTGALDAGGGINLVFSESSFADLSPNSADPDLLLLSSTFPGTDSLVQVISGSGLAAASTTTLSVEFLWLGGGAPGAQAFEVVSVVDNAFVTEQGFLTQASGSPSPVSEPTSLQLLVVASLAFAMRAGRRRRA